MSRGMVHGCQGHGVVATIRRPMDFGNIEALCRDL